MTNFKIRYTWVFTTCLFCLNTLVGQQSSNTYSIIELTLDQKDDISILLDLGIAADHVHWHGAQEAELFVSETELEILDENGFSYDFKVRDTKIHADKLASQHSRSSYKKQDCGLSDYSLGEMGGYKTYEEVIERLKEINSSYPEIAKTRVLGQSVEGNDIIALKISDNVDKNEQLWEGSTYYDALTHAREPLSMMSTLFYIEWLLANYDNPNTIAKYLIDNRELHFVLIVNPDGYIFNRSESPNGGGGWRKNRRVLDNTNCIGVDLNRNFSTKFFGFPGTYSDEPCEGTYRGISPASEPETKLIEEYIDLIQPATAFSSHSFSNVMIDPSSTIDPESYPDYDFDVYAKYASEFTPENYHGYGPANYLIGYEASGTTLSYLYDAGAIVWTPEIGSEFWEPRDKICEIVTDMLEPMKFISKVAGAAPSYLNHHLPDDAFIADGESIELIIGLQNKGLRGSNINFTAEINSATSGVTIENPEFNFDLKTGQGVVYNDDQPFQVNFDDIDEDLPLEFEVRIFDKEVLVDYSTFEILPGSQRVLWTEDFEEGLGNWFQSNDLNRWTTSDTDPKSGKYSLVDSKEFQDNLARSGVGLIEPIDLSDAIKPYLLFDVKHSFSPDGGSATLYVSEDRSLSDTRNGNIIVKTYLGQSYWQQEAIDLTYAAQNFGPLYLKFLMQVGGNRITDGLYVDNIRIVDLGLDNTTSSTDHFLDPSQIDVYPNPALDKVSISSDTYAVRFSKVELYSSVGQKLKTREFINGKNKAQFDLSNLQAGIYFIKIHTEQGLILKRIYKHD